MMTVIRLFRKQTSAVSIPRWFRVTGEPTAQGTAKPGRGGRRKRRRRAAGIRAARPANAALNEAHLSGLPPPAWAMAMLRRADRLIPNRGNCGPWDLGRRERRRRAKLRRRRARREARKRSETKPALLFTPGLWGTLVKAYMFKQWAMRTSGA